MSNANVRVRFAPSPTGPLHKGGVRTALFNYLYAKKYNGTFVLRIEDTDQSRYVAGAEDYIRESLEWIGAEPDEGPVKGGDYGPYRQSERAELYKMYAHQLIDSGWAYYAFDTSEELNQMRERLKAEKASNQQYNAFTRMDMKNSLSLPEEEVNTRIDSGEPYVIRFKMPGNETVDFYDAIREHIEMHTSELDDKILFKSDGMPTYHLANVVDDYSMDITHVIRGEEWLPSTPLHVMLYKALGWESKMPEFAHLPLLLKPDGQGKLSKRDGERLGFPVFPIEWNDSKTGERLPGYREEGYLPEAFVNIIALLGWNPGYDKEIFSMDELISEFSLDNVSKAGAKFDPDKAKWFNHQHLMNSSDERIADWFISELNNRGITTSREYVIRVCSLAKKRANLLTELWDHSYFFFVPPENFDSKVVKKKWKQNMPELMQDLKQVLASVENFEEEALENVVKKWLEEKGLKMGQVMNALRLCITGSNKGPSLFAIMDMIGKDDTLQRIEYAVNTIQK